MSVCVWGVCVRACVRHTSIVKVNVICAANNGLTQCTCNGLIVNGRYWDAIFDLQSKVCNVTFRWSLLVSWFCENCVQMGAHHVEEDMFLS